MYFFIPPVDSESQMAYKRLAAKYSNEPMLVDLKTIQRAIQRAINRIESDIESDIVTSVAAKESGDGESGKISFNSFGVKLVGGLCGGAKGKGGGKGKGLKVT